MHVVEFRVFGVCWNEIGKVKKEESRLKRLPVLTLKSPLSAQVKKQVTRIHVHLPTKTSKSHYITFVVPSSS